MFGTWKRFIYFFLFFFNDTATTEIYTLSLHDALPILRSPCSREGAGPIALRFRAPCSSSWRKAAISISASADRKSTRLNSSHQIISYAVFCLKKKKNRKTTRQTQKHRVI